MSFKSLQLLFKTPKLLVVQRHTRLCNGKLVIFVRTKIFVPVKSLFLLRHVQYLKLLHWCRRIHCACVCGIKFFLNWFPLIFIELIEETNYFMFFAEVY